MRCPSCQHANPADSNFCLGCGERLALVCGSCGTSLPAGSRFCNKCGASVTAEAGVPARFISPETYTPKHLAEKILASKNALEGERKHVTVLFADLKGSMELLADRDPEEARRILDPVLEHMMDAVHRYEGTVNQVMGDGIMALFGAPLAHEDHATRACYAALAMQDAVRRHSEALRGAHGIETHIRVGLNSGEVVVRAVGSDLRIDYSAVGQTVHLAARMEQLAAPGTTRLTADTLRLAEGFVQVQPLGLVPVKGLDAPVAAFELTGVGQARSRLQAGVARGLSRFVGRDPEMDALRRAHELAAAGHGQMVAVVGEPGVGKSRLFWEFTHSHRSQGWLTLESGSVSYGKATAYLPVIDLIKDYCAIADRDDHRAMREKVTGKVLTLDRALEPSLPALLALLDVPGDDAEWRQFDAAQRRERTLNAVKRLLLRESQVQPLLLVFEDLHWVDTETQALLDTLVDSLPSARVLLLVNYRPEYQPQWGSRSYYTQLRIDVLPPESAASLLDALLGTAEGLVPLKALLAQRTEGNPLFLEESVRALAEMGALVGERGAYRLAHALSAVCMPPTVQAVLAARIDRLSADDKRLLQCAAVIGKDVPGAVLEAIADQAPAALRQGLAHLQASEFLYDTALFPDHEYTFKHALTHDVAYGSLLVERRCALHARIADALERLHPDRLAEHTERLAHHAVRGEQWDRAARYLREAGLRAFGRAGAETPGHFEQALLALERLPETRDRSEQAIDIRFDLRNWLLGPGDIPRVLALLEEAERLAIAIGDESRVGRVAAYMTHAYWWMGQPDRAVATGRPALAIAQSRSDLGLEVLVRFHLGMACFAWAAYHEAIEHFRWVVDRLQGDLVRERFGVAGLPASLGRSWLAICLGVLGEFPEAIAHAETALRLVEETGFRGGLANCLTTLGREHLEQGHVDRAIPFLERSVALSREWQWPYTLAYGTGLLGEAYALGARRAEAVSLLEESVELATRIGQLSLVPTALVGLASAYHLTGRFDDARHRAEQALELARTHKQRGTEAIAQRVIGDIRAAGGESDWPAAEAAYREAKTAAEEIGMRPLVAHCHLGLGKLYRRTGKREQAQEYLATAAIMYREMDMSFWLQRAEADRET